MTSSSESHGVQATPGHATSHDVQTSHDAAHGHDHVAAGPYFTEQELSEFHNDDIHAGGAVVCLMAGIFSIGLMLYTTIAIIVAA